jgi:hypothetical protein
MRGRDRWRDPQPAAVAIYATTLDDAELFRLRHGTTDGWQAIRPRCERKVERRAHGDNPLLSHGSLLSSGPPLHATPGASPPACGAPMRGTPLIFP